MSVPLSIDPNDLAQAGWGVVFDGDTESEARTALSALLNLRRSQCGERYREFTYKPGETVSRFLGRHGITQGVQDPERMPYYLLIVGSPERVPFQFQQQLDLGYAVGRLHFEKGDEYFRYAMGVVDAEQSRTSQERRLAVLAPPFVGDRHTEVLAAELIGPLLREVLDDTRWHTHLQLGASATKSAVMDLFRESPPPAMLVAATHAVVGRRDDPIHRRLQGALICQDAVGIGTGTPLQDNQVLSGDDLTRTGPLNLQGMMALLWGSFTAGSMDSGDGTDTGSGTGTGSSGSSGSGSQNPTTSGKPFVSALAQRLLAQGALAVIGSLDRLLGFSFPHPTTTTSTSAQTLALKRVIRSLMAGYRVGHAAQTFDDAYATSAVALSETLERVRFGSDVSAATLASLWATTSDLRNIALIGDPAVRLPAAIRGSNA